MSTVFDMIQRGWDNFLARPSGSFSFRFIVQPAMAALLALRAGIQDAKDPPVAVATRGLARSADPFSRRDCARQHLSAY
jgi:hypothetical protein